MTEYQKKLNGLTEKYENGFSWDEKEMKTIYYILIGVALEEKITEKER